MVWANAFVLGLGGALLTVPVILHFLMQPKPKVIEFPALKFVKRRQFTNTNSTRLRHVLLLLLRCLLILCMAAALAGPSVASRQFGQWVIVGAIGLLALMVLFTLLMVFFKSEKTNVPVLSILGGLLAGLVMYGGWSAVQLLSTDSTELLGDSSAPVSALIVIDNSCRMEYEQENQTNLDRAREIGHWLISQFPAESQVCVLPTNDDLPFFSVDLGAANKRVEGLETSYVNAPVPSRISDGLRLLDEAVHERKEIYIVTDLSQKSWEGAEASIASQLKVKGSIAVFVIDIGFEEINNFSMAPLQLSAQAITTTGAIEVKTNVSRLGAAANRNVRFRIERPDNTRPVIRDGQVLVPDKFIERVKTINVQPLAENPVEFQFSEPLPLGIHHGVVEIVGEDALTIDDRQHFSIEVVESWKLLVVHGDGVSPENFTETIVDDADLNLYDMTIVNQSAMPASFESFDAVIFLDPERGISDTTWSTIEQYVASGHGVGFFLGANAADGSMAHNTFQSKAAQRVLSGKLNRQWRRPSADLFLSPDNLNHPVFAPFRSWETAVPWNRFPIFYHWGLVPDDQGDELPTKTVLRYSNGKPALVERRIGDGVVMVMTTPITDPEYIEGRDSWNSLFSGFSLPAWLLVRQINKQLVQSQADRLNLNVGELARLKNDFRKYPENYRIYTPRTTATVEKVTATDQIIRYRFTDSPGHYRLRGNFDGPMNRGFSVNLPFGETDLTRINPDELDAVFGANRYQLARKKDEIQRQQGTTRRGQEFYPWLLILLVIVLGMENLLANRFYS